MIAQELILDTQQSSLYTRIEEAFNQPFHIKKVTFDADVYVDKAEFYYLTEFHDDMQVTQAHLKKAVGYLVKKKKFQTIIIRVFEGDVGNHLHISLVGMWTFAALKFHGMMMGKEAYRQYYLLEAGDPFDEAKHKRSVQAIAERFAHDGYYEYTIENRFEKDEVTKSITVHLTLKQGNRFSIGRVGVSIASDQLSLEEKDALRQDVWQDFFKKIVNNNYNKAMLNTTMQKLKRYLAKRGFLHVTIELKEQVDYDAQEVNLSFVCDVHKKKHLNFEGNSFFTADQLLDEILLFGQSAWMLPATMMQQEIEQLYYKRGFWSARVRVDERGDNYFFSINEGPRASIKKITLRRVVHGQPSFLIKNYCSQLLKNKHFDDDLLTRSLDNLTAWYTEQGFLDAKILKKDFVALQDPHMYELVLTLDEGDRCYITSVEIKDFPEFEQQGPFLAYKNSKERMPFVMHDVHEQRNWLLATLKKMGYVKVKVQPEFDRHGLSVTLRWKIMVDEVQRHFGKTVIMGSTTFPFAYIARELLYQEGDVWDQDKLKKTLLRLKELEIFDTLHLYPYDAAPQDAEQPISLKLQQDDMCEARVRAGFAVQQVTKELKNAGLTYRIGGSFLVKNPLNCADQLRFETDISRSEMALSVNYRRPWLFGYPVRTTFEGYNNKYLYPGLFGGKRNLYEVDQQGILVGFLRKYNHVDAEINLGIELMRTAIGNDIVSSQMFANQLARAINFEPLLLNQKIPYVLVEPTVIVDFVDNKLRPHKGSFTLVSLKGMFPFGPIGDRSYFVRLTAEQSFFVPLRHMVGAFRLRFGHIFRRALRNIMPPERFYLGGANSVRSYENDRCPPLGVFVDECNRSQLVPQGGKSMVNLNLELRLPIFKSVGAALFQDFGALSSNNVLNEIRACSVLAASGFGVRYETPIGPLRFDIAWKWARSHPQESRYAWFLTFGNAF